MLTLIRRLVELNLLLWTSFGDVQVRVWSSFLSWESMQLVVVSVASIGPMGSLVFEALVRSTPNNMQLVVASVVIFSFVGWTNWLLLLFGLGMAGTKSLISQSEGNLESSTASRQLNSGTLVGELKLDCPISWPVKRFDDVEPIYGNNYNEKGIHKESLTFKQMIIRTFPFTDFITLTSTFLLEYSWLGNTWRRD